MSETDSPLVALSRQMESDNALFRRLVTRFLDELEGIKGDLDEINRAPGAAASPHAQGTAAPTGQDRQSVLEEFALSSMQMLTMLMSTRMKDESTASRTPPRRETPESPPVREEPHEMGDFAATMQAVSEFLSRDAEAEPSPHPAAAAPPGGADRGDRRPGDEKPDTLYDRHHDWVSRESRKPPSDEASAATDAPEPDFGAYPRGPDDRAAWSNEEWAQVSPADYSERLVELAELRQELNQAIRRAENAERDRERFRQMQGAMSESSQTITKRYHASQQTVNEQKARLAQLESGIVERDKRLAELEKDNHVLKAKLQELIRRFDNLANARTDGPGAAPRPPQPRRNIR